MSDLILRWGRGQKILLSIKELWHWLGSALIGYLVDQGVRRAWTFLLKFRQRSDMWHRTRVVFVVENEEIWIKRATHWCIGSLQACDLRWLWRLDVNGLSHSVSLCYQGTIGWFQSGVDWSTVNGRDRNRDSSYRVVMETIWLYRSVLFLCSK